MGCTSASLRIVGRRDKRPATIPEVGVYVPLMRIPTRTDIQRALRGLVPQDLLNRMTCLRNQIVIVAEDTGLISYSFLVLICFYSSNF
uniref:Uncharacterized protein n=1 Tax=Rhizophora mucronata TaxID=61149 RepID=A0A2P2IRG8_RHIMU